jgi:capsular exopolysaccharide synthesis family protein
MNVITRDSGRKDVDLVEVWKIIRKRKWILVSFSVILVVVAAVYSLTRTPLYRASASILIDEPGASPFNIQDLLGSGGYYRADYLGTYFKTQLRLLTSRSLAERVAKKMNLGARPEARAMASSGPGFVQTVKNILAFRWIRGKSGDDTGAPAEQPSPFGSDALGASIVLGGLGIFPVEETRLVLVSHTSPHPVLAADIANSVAEEFVTYSLETRFEATKQTSEFLSEQIAQIRQDLKRKEEELQRYGEEKKLLFLNDNESSIVNKFSEISTAYTEALIARSEKEAKFRELRGLSVESLPQYVDNPVIQSLKTSYLQLKNDYEEKSLSYRADYPEMIKLKSRLDSTRDQLEGELGKAVEAAEAEYRASLSNEASLLKLLETQRTDVSQMGNNAIYYNSLKIDVETMRNLLGTLVARESEIQVSSQLGGIRASNIKVIDKAMVPAIPFTPNIRRNLMIAVLLGLMGGVGLIFLAEYLDNTVKDPEDIEKVTGLASLGIIPHLSPDVLKKKRAAYGSYASYGQSPEDRNGFLPEVTEIELINHLFPKFSISEDYRTVRTSILLSHADSAPKTICFTSSLPQEGKTATVSNLAISFSQLEGKVLIIDADLRKPRLHSVFKARNTTGLSTYLSGAASFEEALQKTSIENIWIMCSGPHPPNPAELLNSKKMKELLKAAKARFDHVLIDTPPVLAVIDPVIVSAQADCTVIVVQAGKTTRKALARSIDDVRKAKADIVGVIFNEVGTGRRGEGSAYHYYQYEYTSKDSGGDDGDDVPRPEGRSLTGEAKAETKENPSP